MFRQIIVFTNSKQIEGIKKVKLAAEKCGAQTFVFQPLTDLSLAYDSKGQARLLTEGKNWTEIPPLFSCILSNSVKEV